MSPPLVLKQYSIYTHLVLTSSLLLTFCETFALNDLRARALLVFWARHVRDRFGAEAVQVDRLLWRSLGTPKGTG